MAFAFISEPARVRLTEGTASAGGRAAFEVLRRDYQRWSRWGMGMAAYLLALGGSFIAVGFGGALLAPGVPAGPADLVVVVLAAAVAGVGVWLLVRLARSGATVLRAASAAMRSDAGRPRARGWLEARTVNFDPPIFVRIVSATLALMIGIAGVALFIHGVTVGVDAMSAAALAIGMLSLAAGAGQAGGVMHLVAALAHRDPLWLRLTNRRS